jgi:hypothetical protein
MVYLIRGCSGPEDEVPWEVFPREVESSSCHPALPWRHQQEEEEEDDEPASTRRGLHMFLSPRRLRSVRLGRAWPELKFV